MQIHTSFFRNFKSLFACKANSAWLGGNLALLFPCICKHNKNWKAHKFSFLELSSLHFALIGEVKHNKKQAVSEAAVDKFVDSIGVVKRDARKQKAICIFVSSTGFAKKAIPILERHKVIYGNLKEVVEKLSL